MPQMSRPDAKWLTAYCGLALQWDQPILEAVNAMWCVITHAEEAVRLYQRSRDEHYVAYGYRFPWAQYKDIWSLRALVAHNGVVLQFIESSIQEQHPDLCLIAVTQTWNALQYVADQTPELCSLAVSQNGIALAHVKEQTLELCRAAVEINPLARNYIRDVAIWRTLTPVQ